MLTVQITIAETDAPGDPSLGTTPASRMEVKMKAVPPEPPKEGEEEPLVTYMESITFEAIKQGISSAMHVLQTMGPEQFKELAEREGGAPSVIVPEGFKKD